MMKFKVGDLVRHHREEVLGIIVTIYENGEAYYDMAEVQWLDEHGIERTWCAVWMLEVVGEV